MLLILLILAVSLLPKDLKWSESKEEKVPFAPMMLFPTTITHTRVSPIRNTFRYRLLLIGIPVGFRGKVGNLLSVDEPLKEVTKKKNRNEKDLFGAVRMSYSTIVTAWFSFDPIRYLHRGDDHRGLKYKLNQFLKSQVCLPFCRLTSRFFRTQLVCTLYA